MLLSDFAFEFGDEVEQETDQAEGGFGAIEGLQARTVSAEVLLELLDAVLALGAAVVEALGCHRVKAQHSHQHMKGVARHFQQFAPARFKLAHH